MKYKITAEYSDCVHCEVTRDDGSTYGQYVYGEARLKLKEVEAVVEAVEQKLIKEETPPDVEDLAEMEETRLAIAEKQERVLLKDTVEAIAL